MATVEVTDGEIPIPTDVTKPADPFGDRGERSAVKQGIRDAIGPRPTSEAWRVSVGATHGDNYVLDFGRNGLPYGPGLKLSVSELHLRAGHESPYDKVRRGVKEGVRLYLQANAVFGGE